MRRREFHGHQLYMKLTEEELLLHSAKNKDYARGGDPLGNFKRVANILDLYPDLDLSDPAVIAIIFSLKQMDAALWMLSQHFEGDTEDFDGRAADTHVYWKIARILHGQQKESK